MHDHHHHYQRFRDEHARRLDEEYQAWRSHRPDGDFRQWRDARNPDTVPVAPRGEGNLQTYGRSISEVVLGTLEPDLSQLHATSGDTTPAHDRPMDGGTEREQRAQKERFFERS